MARQRGREEVRLYNTGTGQRTPLSDVSRGRERRNVTGDALQVLVLGPRGSWCERG